MKGRGGRLIQLILLASISFIAYSNSFHGAFQFDDLRTIRFNFSLRDLTDWNPLIHYERFRPLLNATFALNFAFGKHHPVSYHVVNFSLHVANIILFYFLLRRIVTDHWTAFVSALLMAVHPLNTESVSYISSRSILLCTTFYFAGILVFDSYVRSSRKILIPVFVLLYFLGILTKEEAAMMPVAALLYNAFFFGWKSIRGHRLFHTLTLLLLVCFGALRFTQIVTADQFPHPVATYLATEIKVSWHYLWLAVYPIQLNIDPDVSPLSFGQPVVWIFLLLTAVVALVLWRLRFKHPFVSFWGYWFWLNLLISSSFVPLNDFMAEHRVYISLFGFCACLGYLLVTVFQPRTDKRWFVQTVVIVIVLFYTIASYQRNRVWANELTLWLDSVEKSPNKIRPHLNLGGAYQQRNAHDLAIQEFRTALMLNPNVAQAYSGLGISYLSKNDLVAAEESFEKALQMDPTIVDANIGLGMVHYRRGKYPEALEYLKPQLNRRAESVQVVGMIASSQMRLGQYAEAILSLQHYLRLRPGAAKAHYDLILAYALAGRKEDAARHYESARKQFQFTGDQKRRITEVLSQN
jgi:Flp pilus assembly protein TadD